MKAVCDFWPPQINSNSLFAGEGEKYKKERESL